MAGGAGPALPISDQPTPRMAIGIMDTLRIEELFPTLQARAADGSTLRIPDELHDRVAVLLFYRGHW